MILFFNVAIVRIYVNVKAKCKYIFNIIIALVRWLNPATVQSYSFHGWTKTVFSFRAYFCATKSI